MRQLAQNVMRMYGSEGTRWVAQLPSRVELLSLEWKLHTLIPYPNLNFNYVVSAVREETPVVLKLFSSKEQLESELKALTYFEGKGCIKCIDAKPDDKALLLEKVSPGTSLKTYFPDQEQDAIDVLYSVVKNLKKENKASGFPKVTTWLQTLEKISTLPQALLEKARELVSTLTTSEEEWSVLHGDLHLENILQGEKEWKVIDPKGVYGPLEFELAAFVLNPLPEIVEIKDLKNFLEKRIDKISQTFACQKETLQQWCFVRALLMARWCEEDNLESKNLLTLAKVLN